MAHGLPAQAIIATSVFNGGLVSTPPIALPGVPAYVRNSQLGKKASNNAQTVKEWLANA